MRRRDILKALATVPFASVLGNCMVDRSAAQAAPPKGKNVQTLQILLEGAFAVVLQKNKDNPNRLIAFVPRFEPDGHGFDHNFFFNDPTTARPAIGKDPAGYHFQLSGQGLKSYPETYIDAGFADFTAYTQKWRLTDRVVTIELPFPNSINFSGRPLHVEFASGRPGLMPTNYILDYYIEDAEKVKLTCSQLGDKCSPSSNCPPGVLRYFFGVSPRSDDGGEKHAVTFFNMMIRRCFPELEEHILEYIEPAEKKGSRTSSALRPRLMPGVLTSDSPAAHLLGVSAVLDCQLIGPVVHTGAKPTGG
ncbi:MAG TPA: hypothetical protein VGQ12_05080 [Candidatus Angelobacter sp.]|nr:hypothetical protein [Candidatus Angelobacter sp.]